MIIDVDVHRFVFVLRREAPLLCAFGDCLLDVDRRELKRGANFIAMEPQVFDVLVYLIQNRDRVVSKDDLLASVWGGRIVSESTLTSRINAARSAIGDSGGDQHLIRTIARKGVRFVGQVREVQRSDDTGSGATTPRAESDAMLQPRRPLRHLDSRTSLPLPFCPSPTCPVIPNRNISVTGSPRIS